MPSVLRWGRSAYETDADLNRERQAAERLGLNWSHQMDAPQSPVDALVVNSRVRVTSEVLERIRPELVLTTTSGHDHIDLSAAQALGIRVGRCPIARRDAVVHTTLAALFALARELPRTVRAAQDGHWARGDLPALAPSLLTERTVAVVGCGVIGTQVCQALAALGVPHLAVDPAGTPSGHRPANLVDALHAADLVTLHCRLRGQTRNLIDDAALQALGPQGGLVNTARGDIVDWPALRNRLRDGQFRGAVCDVFPTEPLPDLQQAAQTPGLWILPHAAGFTHDLGRRVATEVEAALQAWSSGQPLPHEVHED